MKDDSGNMFSDKNRLFKWIVVQSKCMSECIDAHSSWSITSFTSAVSVTSSWSLHRDKYSPHLDVSALHVKDVTRFI